MNLDILWELQTVTNLLVKFQIYVAGVIWMTWIL